MRSKALTVTLEPVATCNLGCKYCYSTNAPVENLEEGVFLSALRQIARYAGTRDFKEVHCVWLGGEPLLAGIPFFERVASLTSALSSSVRIRHFVQTNGLLLDDDACRFFRDAGFHLGVSLDGPQDIHDAFRITRHGEPTHRRVLEGIGLLREHRVPFGCVSVVTRRTLGREQEVYDFFRSLGCGFRINPIIPDAKGVKHVYQIEPEEYGQSLVRFFDAWSVAEADRVNVSPLDNYVLAVVGGEPLECQHQAACATHSLGIKPNGDVTICGRFQNLALGNLTRAPMTDLLAAMEADPLRARTAALDGCRACVYWSLCHGGCPHNAVAFGRDSKAKDPFCAAYKMIFSHIQKALSA
ncbi:MAG: radical SAM protein [Solidesulfovibrio sp.]